MQPDKKPAAAPAAHTPARWAAGGNIGNPADFYRAAEGSEPTHLSK